MRSSIQSEWRRGEFDFGAIPGSSVCQQCLLREDGRIQLLSGKAELFVVKGKFGLIHDGEK
jgi:hypothetical protein